MGVCLSKFSDISLSQFVTVNSAECTASHYQPCAMCSPFLSIASIILKNGYHSLREGFTVVYPRVPYDTEKAKRKLLVMPLACIRIRQPSGGKAFNLLLELMPAVDYSKIARFLNSFLSAPACQKIPA